MPDLNQTATVFKLVKAKTVKKEGEETLTLWTPATGKKFRLFGANLFFSVEATLTLLDEATEIFQIGVPAKTNVDLRLAQLGIQSGAAGNKLKINVSAEGALTGTVYGTEDAY